MPATIGSKLSIRFANAADSELIFQFIHALATYEKLAHEVVATSESIRQSLFGATPAAEVVLAELDHTPIGFALFFHNYSTFLGQRGIYLEDLFVTPEYRGCGAGKALLEFLAALCVKRGCGRLEWSVLNWNESAIGFYKKLGARPLEGWSVFRLSGSALQDLAGN